MFLCNFYFLFTVTTEYWLYLPYCAVHPWASLTPSNLYLPLPHPYVFTTHLPTYIQPLLSFDWSIQSITFRVIIGWWEHNTAILSFVFWLLYICIVFLSWISICHFGLVIFYDIFLSFLLLKIFFFVSALDLCFILFYFFVHFFFF